MLETPPARRLYALSSIHHHLFENGDHERLWRLLRDEGFQQQQLELFHRYQESYTALELGLRAFAERNGSGQDDDPRLCWLAQRASQIVHEASTDYGNAFERAENLPLHDPQRITKVLDRFQNFDQQELFLILMNLLWIETDRARVLPPEERQTSGLWQIFEVFNNQTSEAPIDWTSRMTPEFLVVLGKQLVETFGAETDEQQRLENAFFRPLMRLLEAIPFARSNAGYVQLNFATCLVSHQLFELALEAAHSISSEWERSKALSTIVEHLSRNGDLQRASKVCEQIPFYADQEQALFAVAREAYRLGHLEMANSLFDSIPDPELQARLLTDLGGTLARSGQIEEARLKFFEAIAAAARLRFEDADEIQSTSALAERIVTVLRAAWKSGIREDALWQAALSDVSTFRENHTKTKTLKAIALFLVKNDDFANALAVAETMDQESGGWWCETVAEISKALTTRHRVGPSRAQRLLGQALSVARGIYWRKPDALAAVAEGLAVCGQVEAGAEIFAEAIEAIGRPLMEWQYAETLDIVLTRLCNAPALPDRKRLLLQVLELTRAMETAEFRARVLPNATRKILRIKDCGNTDKLLAKVEGLGSEASTHSSTEHLIEVIEILCNFGCLENAHRLAELISEGRTSVFLALGRRLAAIGEPRRALGAFLKAFRKSQDILRFSQRQDELLETITQISRCGFPVEALALIRNLGHHDTRLLMTSAILPEIFERHGSVRARKVFEATLLRAAPFTGLDFRAMTSIAVELNVLGHQQRATSVMRHVLRAVTKLDDEAAVEEALNHIAHTLEKSPQLLTKNPELANLTKSLCLDLEARKEQALRILIPLFVNSGELEQAAALASEIASAFSHTDALALVARGWMMKKAYGRASALFVEALTIAREHDSKFSSAQAKVVQHLIAVDSFPGRNDLLRTAVIDAAQRKWDSEKADALKTVTEAILKAEDVAEVMEVLELAGELTEKTEMLSYLEDLKIEIGGALARSGYRERALEFVRKLPPMQRAHAQTMTQIVLALSERGELSEALRLLPKIADEWPRAYAASKLGEKLADTPGLPDCQAIFHQLIILVRETRDFEKRLQSLKDLSRAAANAGVLDKLRKPLLEELSAMETHAEECRTEAGRSRFREEVVQLWILMHNIRRALRFISSIEADEGTTLYAILVRQLLETSDVPQLHKFLPRISNRIQALDRADTRADALACLALIYARAGNADDTYRAFERSLGTVSTIDSSWDRRAALSRTLSLIEEAGKCLEPSPLWPQFIACVCTLDTQRDQSDILAKFALIVVELGGDSEALAALQDDRVANSARQNFLLRLQTELAKQGPRARARLRNVFIAFPFEASLGLRSVQIFLEHCLRCRDLDTFNAVLEQCRENSSLKGLAES